MTPNLNRNSLGPRIEPRHCHSLHGHEFQFQGIRREDFLNLLKEFLDSYDPCNEKTSISTNGALP